MRTAKRDSPEAYQRHRTCVRSSAACLLANVSLRHKTWLDWDESNWTVRQEAIRPYLKSLYREPWKLEV